MMEGSNLRNLLVPLFLLFLWGHLLQVSSATMETSVWHNRHLLVQADLFGQVDVPFWLTARAMAVTPTAVNTTMIENPLWISYGKVLVSTIGLRDRRWGGEKRRIERRGRERQFIKMRLRQGQYCTFRMKLVWAINEWNRTTYFLIHLAKELYVCTKLMYMHVRT